jgi:mRNA interferase MazF
MVKRGDIWWADLEEPRKSEPGYARPVLIIQSDAFTQSRLQTVLAVVLTSNLRRARDRGNVLLPAGRSGLSRDSVANVTQIVTLDKSFLLERCGNLGGGLMKRVEDGLRLVLGLGD